MSMPVKNAKEPSDKGCLRTRALTAIAAVGYAGFLFAAGIAPTSPITPTLSADMYTGLLGASFQTGYLAAYFVLAVLAKTTCGGLRWRCTMAGGAFLSIGYVLQGLFWAEPSLTQIGALGNTIGGIGFACLAFAWLVSMVSLGDGGSVFVLLMGSALASCVSLLFCLTGLPLSSVFAPVAPLILSLCCLGYLAWDRRRRGAPLGEVVSGQGGVAPLTEGGISDDKQIPDDLALGATLRRVGIPILCASLLVLVGPTVGFGAINASLAPVVQPVVANIGLLAAVIFLALALRIIPGSFTIQRVYLVMFPVLATMLLVLTFSGNKFAVPFLVVTYFSYNLTSLLMILFCLRWTKNEVAAVVMYGVMAGVVYAVSTLGAWCGAILSAALVDNMALSVLTFVVLYILALAVLFVSRQSRRADRGDVPSAVVTIDVATARCQAIARSHELTERETEVLCYLARGRDVPAIAEKMLVSKDTVKVHMKGIYRKLDVHTRQELIDLIERDEVR